MFRDEEISQWLGYSATDMGTHLCPQLNAEQHHTYSKLIGKVYAYWFYRKEKARWYPHAMDVVKQLKQDRLSLLFCSVTVALAIWRHIRSILDCKTCLWDFILVSAYHFIPKYEVF